MFKKLVLTALVVGAGLFILNHTRLGSYGHTAFGKIKKAAQREVPVEFEIDRIRHEISQLTPDIRKHLSGMAKEIVAIDNLKEEIQVAQANLTKKTEQLQAAREQLKSGIERVAYDGREYRKPRLLERLSGDVVACANLKKKIELSEGILEAKERGLESAKEQLQSMRDQKEELELEVARMEAEVKATKVAQTKSKFVVDDTRLSQIKDSIRSLKNRLKEDKLAVQLEGEFIKESVPAKESKTVGKTEGDVLKELNSFLGEPAEVASSPKK
jgi:chromosome segregation ATPase